MTTTAKLLLIALSSFVFFNSCKKQVAVCTGDCFIINANGQVVNKSTNTSAAGVPVSLEWVKFDGLSSQSEGIATVSSKTDGTFDFTSSIDTTYFSKGYFLSLSVHSNDDYIVLAFAGVTELRSYLFDPNAFQSEQFEVYTKANLKIKLHRTLDDNFQRYEITHSNVKENLFLNDYSVQSPQEVIDRNTNELDVATVADVYTRIMTAKTFADGTSTTTLDSVKCTTDSTSVYNVTF
jgi:hypothetical protein